jgi:D-alanine-D-alanine ligase-like ATP-grasp enzyme
VYDLGCAFDLISAVGRKKMTSQGNIYDYLRNSAKARRKLRAFAPLREIRCDVVRRKSLSEKQLADMRAPDRLA